MLAPNMDIVEDPNRVYVGACLATVSGMQANITWHGVNVQCQAELRGTVQDKDALYDITWLYASSNRWEARVTGMTVSLEKAIDYVPVEINIDAIKVGGCTCGADKVGEPYHYKWCDKVEL